MEYKNLEHYRFKWFGNDEIRNLEEVREKLPFITGFSFGSFTPYYLYLFFHQLWDLFLLQFVSNFIIIFVFYIGYFIFLFSRGFGSDKLSDMDDPIHMILLCCVIFIMIIIQFSILIYSGFHSRKLSWNRCEWKSYEAFEQGEKNWNIVGLIFFVLNLLSIFLLIGAFLLFSTLLLT